LDISFHNFDRPMGLAIDAKNDQIAIAGKTEICLMRNARDVAAQLSSETTCDACFLARSSHVTGEIQSHEISWAANGELWIVNTLFSCLCTLDERHSFVPRWQPPFISELAAEDRCHLNGLAMHNGVPKYVTAMAESDTAGGWRPTKGETGCLIDVASRQTVVQGFSMPHSPRIHNDQVWVLDSGRGAFVKIDPGHGKMETVARFPGYTRGMAMFGKYACIGLSRIRETSTFGGVPIAEHRDRLKCGVVLVDLEQGSLVGQFEFKTGVEEIFDVSVIPNCRSAAIRGPFAHRDGYNTVWVVPQRS